MRKLIFISLSLVVALGMLGVGYCSWGQNLQVNGHVSTGSWKNFNIAQSKTNDNGSTGNINDPDAQSSWSFPTWVWSGHRLNNNRASSTASVGALVWSGNTGTATATIAMNVAGNYSGSLYDPSLTLSFVNNSSVPLRISDVVSALPVISGVTGAIYRYGYTINGVFTAAHSILVPVGATVYYELDMEFGGSRLKQNFNTRSVTVTFTVRLPNMP
jgi:hypothetical protein